jgi:hypothetical protein
MTQLPNVSSYGRYSSENYGVNTLKISVGTITFYYSYQTIVAYSDFEDGLTVCENAWGVTTGKHLNWINPDKSSRLPYDEFQNKLQKALERHVQ